MNAKQKRVEAILKELYNIHEELFGQKYSIGLTLDESSEFNLIIDEFRNLIFTIKSSQQERDLREAKKNYLNTPDRVRINHEIRQDIARAQEILKQAAKRFNSGQSDPLIVKNRQKVLKNSYNLLKDVKEQQQGGTYKPPEYPSLQQIKLELLQNRYGNEDEGKVNIDEQIAMGEYDEKDRQMDKVLEEIIEGNRDARHQMEGANKKIDITREIISKGNKKAEALTARVKKADKDLAQILKTYQRPSQFCLNITLVLMLLALMVVIINLIKGQTA